MGMLIVGSSNPDLSYVLQKMPASVSGRTEPYQRKIRKGIAYGWFTKKNQEFKLWFKDHDSKSSFASGTASEFEYLDTSRYGSPYLPISLITECLSTALKKIDERDVEGFEAYVKAAIKVSNEHSLQALIKHYGGIATIETQPLHGSFQIVTVRASLIHTAVNVMVVVCLLQCLYDEDTQVDLKRDGISKYLACLNAASAPYFVRYLFKTRVFHNRKTFEDLREQLNGPGMSIVFGNTQVQRFDAILPYLKGGDTLIDIGCGEMFHALKLQGKYETIYTVDPDAELQEANKRKLDRRQIENIVPLVKEATPTWVKENEALFDGADVILIEVIEHMPLEDAKALIEAILKTGYRRLIITTPNKDFNKHYGFDDDEKRHHDHEWEMGFSEFSNWIARIAESDSAPGIAGCLAVNASASDLAEQARKNVAEVMETAEDSGFCLVSSFGDAVDGTAVTSYAVFVRGKEAAQAKPLLKAA